MNQLDPVVRRLREQLPALTILENEPMRAHCSFRIGGPVRALAQPSSAEETAALCRILRSADVTPLIIGNGTNLLVTDAELNRIVIQMGDNMAEAGQTVPVRTHGLPLAFLDHASRVEIIEQHHLQAQDIARQTAEVVAAQEPAQQPIHPD